MFVEEVSHNVRSTQIDAKVAEWREEGRDYRPGVLVDEVHMLDITSLDAIDRAISESRAGPHANFSLNEWTRHAVQVAPRFTARSAR